MTDRRNIVGERVRAARDRAQPPLTQAELSARLATRGLRLGRVPISKIESGARAVTDREVAALAEALAVPIAWLFGDEGSTQ